MKDTPPTDRVLDAAFGLVVVAAVIVAVLLLLAVLFAPPAAADEHETRLTTRNSDFGERTYGTLNGERFDARTTEFAPGVRRSTIQHGDRTTTCRSTRFGDTIRTVCH
jgi:hypothetical protein